MSSWKRYLFLAETVERLFRCPFDPETESVPKSVIQKYKYNIFLSYLVNPKTTGVPVNDAGAACPRGLSTRQPALPSPSRPLSLAPKTSNRTHEPLKHLHDTYNYEYVGEGRCCGEQRVSYSLDK